MSAGSAKPNVSDDTAAVEALVRAYYAALEQGTPLHGFYVRDEAAGALGPVVKIGSGKDEEFTGYAAVARAVDEVTATFARNRLESRALRVRRQGEIAWFSDLVWWRGEAPSVGAANDKPGTRESFASLTRWTGVCLRSAAGWKFLQVHVSEGV